MKTALCLFLALLPGCAAFDTAQTAVAARGGQAADEARESAEWAICNGISVGAWRRAYGSDATKADAWRRLCSGGEETPADGR